MKETTDPDLQAIFDDLDAQFAPEEEEQEESSKEEEGGAEPAQEQEPQAASTDDAPASEEEVEQAPATPKQEKILGKFNSHDDLEKSYVELERWTSQVASEKAAFQKQLEELKSKLEKPEVDPLQSFEKEWEDSPLEATKRLYAQQRDEARQEAEQKQEQALLEQRKLEAQSFYEQSKKENPDFAELEQEMVALHQHFAPIVNPSFGTSKEIIQALYFMARGKNIDRYEKAASEKAKKQAEVIKAEKRKAKSESSYSDGGSDEPDMADLDKFQEMLERGDTRAIENDLKLTAKKLS